MHTGFLWTCYSLSPANTAPAAPYFITHLRCCFTREPLRRALSFLPFRFSCATNPVLKR